MGNAKRAAIYVRVSTAEQNTDSQETESRQYVESRGWECVVYRDKGQSGARNYRPALNQMLNDLRAGVGRPFSTLPSFLSLINRLGQLR
jgi:DNA invertase Pin-like site-specific DNA recombinase